MNPNRKPKTIDPDDVDPSVYYYDEVYDDMQQTHDDKTATEQQPKQKQGSKYIQGIIETADRRKSEKEIRKFKKYARDREEAQANGNLDDEEVYVTKSYAKKLKEITESMKKHSNPDDDDRVLNSFKRVKHSSSDARESQDRNHSGHLSTKPSESERSDHKLPSSPHHSQTTSGKLASEHVNKRERPKTVDERREYLRRILAKRTIGDVFLAAQERYRQRKAKLVT